MKQPTTAKKRSVVKLHGLKLELNDAISPSALVTSSYLYSGEALRPTSIHCTVPFSMSFSPLRYQKPATRPQIPSITRAILMAFHTRIMVASYRATESWTLIGRREAGEARAHHDDALPRAAMTPVRKNSLRSIRVPLGEPRSIVGSHRSGRSRLTYPAPRITGNPVDSSVGMLGCRPRGRKR